MMSLHIPGNYVWNYGQQFQTENNSELKMLRQVVDALDALVCKAAGGC